MQRQIFISASYKYHGSGRMRVRLPFSRTMHNYFKKAQFRNIPNWSLSDSRLDLLVSEFERWEKQYLPADLRGKTVLDVGAGEGETAYFFLLHGAKKVICIEPDEKCYARLVRNAAGKPIQCLHKEFQLADLDILHDFMKMDIEGWEYLLLETELKMPAAVELHGLPLRQKFRDKGYRVLYDSQSSIGCNAMAYWMC